MPYIIVCVKQVPDINEVRLDAKTNTLLRSGVKNTINPYDAYALEAALKIKDNEPEIKVITLSMGPEPAEEVLRHTLALGADYACLVSDPVFSGSDTFGTALILSEAIKKFTQRLGEPAAVFCGRQAIDGDTAQVGPALACRLGYAYLGSALEASFSPGLFTVSQERNDAIRKYEICSPCLLSFTKPAAEPRQASLRRRLAAAKAEIFRLNSDIIPAAYSNRLGLKGSPTEVIRIFSPPLRGKCRIVRGSTEKKAELFAEYISKLGLMQGGGDE